MKVETAFVREKVLEMDASAEVSIFFLLISIVPLTKGVLLWHTPGITILEIHGRLGVLRHI